MSNFKVTCQIITEANRNRHNAIIYVEALNEDDAESMAKQHYTLERTDSVFFGVVKIELA